jgi:hypothetical protein
MDVAVASGAIVRCSAVENRALFDAVRAGLGQCGVVLRVEYPLRPFAPFVTTQTFVYTDARAFMGAASALAREGAAGLWIAASTAVHPARPGRSVLALSVGRENGGEDLAPLAPPGAAFALPARRQHLWPSDGAPRHGLFHRFGGDGAHEAGPLHPWVEHLLPPEDATDALDHLLEHGGDALAHGRAGVIFLRRTHPAAPLFVTPPGPVIAGLGVFFEFPATRSADAHALAGAYAARMRRFGAKRYLSGYVTDTSPAAWAAHFGAAWPAFCAAYASRPRPSPQPGVPHVAVRTATQAVHRAAFEGAAFVLT